MRTLLLALCLAACAPAVGPRPVNVATIRNQIEPTIQRDHDREITAMGHVTEQLAVVYTRRADGTRREETWVREGDHWKLDHAAPLAGATASPSARATP